MQSFDGSFFKDEQYGFYYYLSSDERFVAFRSFDIASILRMEESFRPFTALSENISSLADVEMQLILDGYTDLRSYILKKFPFVDRFILKEDAPDKILDLDFHWSEYV